MWSSRPLGPAVSVIALLALAACTVEPLNASRTNSSVANGTESASVASILAATQVAPVKTRVAQQVRNELLFAMNGGKPVDGGKYRVSLSVTTLARLVSVEQVAQAPTSAQVQVQANYSLVDKSTGTRVAKGKRIALAAYDRTPQSFANQRAQRDAQNRAAKDLARQLRLIIGQTIAGL